MGAHPDTVSQLLCSSPCCCVWAGGEEVVDWTALGVETAHPAADIGLEAGEALVPE